MKNKNGWSIRRWRPGLRAAGNATLLCAISSGILWAGTAKELDKINVSCRQVDRSVKNEQTAGLTVQYLAVSPAGVGEEWKSFQSESDFQSAFPKGCAKKAVVYRLSGIPVLVACEFEGPTKEWVQNLKYYFREDGTLEKVHYDLRKFGAYEKNKGDDQEFLVKAIRDYFYDSRGKCIKKTKARCFNTSNGREIDDAVFKDVPMPVYKQIGKLPFYSLILTP